MSEPSSEPSENVPPAHHRREGSTRWIAALAVLALIAGLVGVGLAVWTRWWPPASSTSAPSYSDAQHVDAKRRTCEAYELVRKGVSLNTKLQPPGGPADVTGAMAVAANARVSLYDGGQYLLARLEPATPTDLADPVRKFAKYLMDIGAAATAGAPNTDPAQATRLKEAEELNGKIENLCK